MESLDRKACLLGQQEGALQRFGSGAEITQPSRPSSKAISVAFHPWERGELGQFHSLGCQVFHGCPLPGAIRAEGALCLQQGQLRPRLISVRKYARRAEMLLGQRPLGLGDGRSGEHQQQRQRGRPVHSLGPSEQTRCERSGLGEVTRLETQTNEANAELQRPG